MSPRTFLFILSVVLTAVTISCNALGSGPSDSEAKTAIEKTIVSSMSGGMSQPPLWQGGEQVKVSSVNILKRGDYNETSKYYPIQAKIDGSFVQKSYDGGVMSGLGASRNCTFSGNGDFRLSKNDYGQWTAQLVLNNESVKTNCDK